MELLFDKVNEAFDNLGIFPIAFKETERRYQRKRQQEEVKRRRGGNSQEMQEEEGEERKKETRMKGKEGDK